MTDTPVPVETWDEVHVWPSLAPAVQAIAELQAMRDRDTLARLIAEGKVEKGDPTRVPGGRAFRDDIERRVNVMKVRNGLMRPPVNLAIRPKKSKGKGKR